MWIGRCAWGGVNREVWIGRWRVHVVSRYTGPPNSHLSIHTSLFTLLYSHFSIHTSLFTPLYSHLPARRHGKQRPPPDGNVQIEKVGYSSVGHYFYGIEVGKTAERTLAVRIEL